MLDLSVIIPHCGCQDMLDLCLESLPAACEGLKYELILVNNNPPNQEMRFDHPAKVVRNVPAAMINRSWTQGCNIADGRVLAVVNDDVIFGARSMSLCVQAMATFGVESIYPSHTSRALPENFDEQVQQAACEPLQLVGPPEFCGFCFLLSSVVYNKIGPFDDQFGHHYGDVDTWYRLVLAGHAPRQLKNALVHHFNRTTFERFDSEVPADVDPACVPSVYQFANGNHATPTCREQWQKKWRGVTGQELVERVYGKRTWEPEVA